ncbi:hypothetical protein LZC95_04850 [Pendulispora brunnea]|uniref:Uncharacterized protein n=1 Tax=Pendulispora brunnea TaxID=2905690 RepID=A0ABZ2KBX4_9BACT
MRTSMPSHLQERLSEMHALRHEVHSRLHLAGLEEIVEWQDLEAESMELENAPVSEIIEGRLAAIIERFVKLRASIAEGIPDSRSVFVAAAKVSEIPENLESPSGRLGRQA